MKLKRKQLLAMLITSSALVSIASSQDFDAETLVNFTRFAYTANKGHFEDKDQKLMNSLINDGWGMKTFSTKTGTASNQIKSIGGVVATKGDQIVVATRGTVTLHDWQTNFRPTKSLWQSACSLLGFGKKENDTTTANFFYGVNGSVAQGNLQRHLSSWNEISDLIIGYANSRGIQPSDLNITFAGHSQGAAQANLNALNAVTDKRFGFMKTLSDSFVVPQGEDLAMSFHAIGNYAPVNNGNVGVLNIEPPHVFSDEAAQDVKKMIGEKNITNIINAGDIVPMLPPKHMGFKHVGEEIRIDSGHYGIAAHKLSNIAGNAISALKRYWTSAPAA